jgi:hypothetical protein
MHVLVVLPWARKASPEPMPKLTLCVLVLMHAQLLLLAPVGKCESTALATAGADSLSTWANTRCVDRYLATKHHWTDYYPVDIQRRAAVDFFLAWHHRNTRELTIALFAPLLRPDLNVRPLHNLLSNYPWRQTLMRCLISPSPPVQFR